MSEKVTDEEFKAAMMRAVGAFDGVGKGGSRRPAHVQLATDTALVEVTVLTVRSGALVPPCFLQHPPHLPEGGELRALVAGDAAKDAQLRIDAFGWAQINRTEVGRSAVSLRNAIHAARLANELLNDGDADERLHGWMHEINDYVAAAFAIDPREAPYPRDELDAWCIAKCNRANPVPEWLREHRPTAAAKYVRDPVPGRDTGRSMMRTYGERDDD